MSGRILSGLLVVTSLVAGCATSARNGESPSATGLANEHADLKFTTLAIRPDTDFSTYREVYFADPTIEFRRGWKNDMDLYDPFRITARDIELIKKTLTTELHDSLTTSFAQAGDLSAVDSPGEHSLTLRPSILDLYINNPDNLQPYQTTTLGETAASMEIVFELADSKTGDVLLQASGRDQTRDYLSYDQQDIVKNRADIGKLLSQWSNSLRDLIIRLQAAETKPGK